MSVSVIESHNGADKDIINAKKESTSDMLSMGTQVHDECRPTPMTVSNDVKISPSNDISMSGKPKKRHRRGSKKNKPRKPRHKYKPYNKLTWDEKRKLDELDAVKAVKRREELVLQKGRAIAPYNTTQFLMEEHDPGDSSLPSNEGNTSIHGDSSSSYSSDEYFEKDFEDFYDRVHIDTLNSYTKEDLVNNVYELEKRIESLEKDARCNNIQFLKDENARLSLENEQLKKYLVGDDKPNNTERENFL